MKQGDVGWSEARRQSSRTLAFYIESQGLEWTSIREAAHIVADQLGIITSKKRRSTIAIECHEKLTAMSILPGANYVAPWLRNGAPPVLRQSKKAMSDCRTTAFYDSIEWKRLRFDILKARGRRCECCGAGPDAAMLHVDHIKPVRKHWNRRLDPDNLQVLCEGCNRGKGSRDETDFRT